MLKTLFPLNDFLYILQLEDYNNVRYTKHLPRFFWRRHIQNKDHLHNTRRIKQSRVFAYMTIFFLSLVLGWGSAALFGNRTTAILLLFLSYLIFFSSVLSPLIVLLTNLILDPIYNQLKLSQEKQARALVDSCPDLQIIAITGSFGKTTTKHILYQLLKSSYRTQYIPGTINTAIGIANWVTANLQDSTQVLIVEMDAYYPGEIARACAVTPPNIALITTFGDQHLEKLGSFQNLITTNLEIFTHAKPNAKLFLNSTDYQKAQNELSKNNISLQKLNNLKIQEYDLFDTVLYQNSNAPTASFQHPVFKINLQHALQIAEFLKIETEYILHSIPKLEPPDRRKNINTVGSNTIIDDSYNISEITARSAVKQASQLADDQKKNLVVVTAGIPERGKESREVNKKYGQFLGEYANYIILIHSVYTPYISTGLAADPARSAKAFTASRLFDYADVLKSNNIENSVILLQSELTDLHF
jgi:UDP-N-acetylmuramoyl-tripeptide--D-alanyl-D-alanine ligase